MNKPMKRRSSRNVDEGEPSCKKGKTPEKDEFSELLERMKKSDYEVAKKYGKRLKAVLSDEAKIKKFISNQTNVEDLVSIFSKQTTFLGSELYNNEIHQYSISIIANCCFSFPKTGFILKKATRNFLELAVRTFESTTVNSETRSSLCRLIGNLCSNKELVSSWISSNTIVFDRVALLLESSDSKIVKQCLRIFTNLSVASFSRVIMLSNGGFYLGKLITTSDHRDDAIKILKILLKRHTKVLDRQLSSSNCSESIVDLFFEENSKYRQFVIDIFSSTVCVREQMETESFIERLLETNIAEKYRMMAAFSQTAWGRAKLRTSGALDVLIEKLSVSTSNEEKLAIVASFRHFVHDTAGMRHLSENIVFVNTVVRDVNKYVNDYKSECQPSVDLEFVRKLHTRLHELSSQNDPNSLDYNSLTNVDRLHKDFYSMWSYDTPQTSPRRIASASVSPSYFSPSPSYSFPSSKQSSGSSSPVIERRSDGILDELSDVESDHGAGTNREDDDEKDKIDKTEKAIVEGELWLLTWQSQDDNTLQFLVRPDVVECVISYLRNTQNPEFRTYRVLRRMATLRTHVYHLIDMQFHIRILNGLCASPCRMLKYSKPCKQCDSRSEHGREILREFASHVDNSYGDAHINSQFEKQDFLNRTKAAIAKIVLVKERIRLAKVPALNELFGSLDHILSTKEIFEEFGKLETYPNGPSLVSQIIGALSILMSGQRIRELCENDSWYFPVDTGKGNCCLENLDSKDGDELLNFVDENDEVIATAPMTKICENSEYFQAMFSLDFMEKTENIRTFCVDSENCSPDDFRVFIHLLSSCDSSCTTVKSASQCANLLGLSDRYLCTNLSKMLCANDGPLRTFLNGESLSVLLPVALTTNAHPTLLDTVFLTLVRFTSNEDVTRALESICMNTTMVSTFIQKLRPFLI